MVTNVFNVNDSKLRELFLRHEFPGAIEELDAATVPHWGKMRPQEMVEHLTWAFELSTGEAQTECAVPASELTRVRRFLYSNGPTPKEFMNPALVAGLPPMRHATLEEAKAALRLQLEHFLDGPRSDDQLYIHPIFGPIGHDEWHRTHYKHAHHHLLQFGLVGSE